MKYVVVGDIHGDYDALMTALDKAQFNINEDCFIGLGDYFDRGEKNLEVLQFLREVPHKMLVMGNHDIYLYRCLQSKKTDYYDFRNGTVGTICDLAGVSRVVGSNLIALQCADEIFNAASKQNILAFYRENMRMYFETPNHYFTHGWLPMTDAGKIAPKLDKISDRRWLNAAQGRSVDSIKRFIEKNPTGCGKTIVVGHWAADDLKYQLNNDERYFTTDSWTGEKYVNNEQKIIGLDSTTVITHRCDFLIIPEEEI